MQMHRLRPLPRQASSSTLQQVGDTICPTRRRTVGCVTNRRLRDRTAGLACLSALVLGGCIGTDPNELVLTEAPTAVIEASPTLPPIPTPELAPVVPVSTLTPIPGPTSTPVTATAEPDEAEIEAADTEASGDDVSTGSAGDGDGSDGGAEPEEGTGDVADDVADDDATSDADDDDNGSEAADAADEENERDASSPEDALALVRDSLPAVTDWLPGWSDARSDELTEPPRGDSCEGVPYVSTEHPFIDGDGVGFSDGDKSVVAIVRIYENAAEANAAAGYRSTSIRSCSQRLTSNVSTAILDMAAEGVKVLGNQVWLSDGTTVEVHSAVHIDRFYVTTTVREPGSAPGEVTETWNQLILDRLVSELT